MKLLIPGLLLVAAIAAVVWVLVPTGTPESTAGARRTPASTARTAQNAAADSADDDRDDRPQATPGTGKGAEALAAARAQAARAQAANAANAANAVENGGGGDGLKGNGLGAIAAAGIEPDEVPDRGDTPSKWGRQGREPAKVLPKQVKDTVRAYYSNLPKSGLVPANVKLEEIFPLAIIDEMNLPPGGRVIELGPYPIGDRRAFDDVLMQPDGNLGALGVTVITPDGERVREYLFLETSEVPAPTNP
jgi:hypothetical protein